MGLLMRMPDGLGDVEQRWKRGVRNSDEHGRLNVRMAIDKGNVLSFKERVELRLLHADFFFIGRLPHRDLVYLVDASCDSLRGQYGRTDERAVARKVCISYKSFDSVFGGYSRKNVPWRMPARTFDG